MLEERNPAINVFGVFTTFTRGKQIHSICRGTAPLRYSFMVIHRVAVTFSRQRGSCVFLSMQPAHFYRPAWLGEGEMAASCAPYHPAVAGPFVCAVQRKRTA